MSEQRDRLFTLLAAKRGLVAPAGITRRDPADPVPLLPGQRQLWFLDRLGVSAYTMAQAWWLTGELRVDLLQQSIDRLLDRHEGLRVSFADADGEPVLRIAGACAAPLSIVVAQGEPMAALAAELDRPFDLTKPPLLRAILVRCADQNGRHLFALAAHHIVCDGPSLSTLVAELSQTYGALLSGTAVAAPAAVSACDYAVWQHGRDVTAHGRYWQEHLSGVPTLLELPTDRPRPATQSYRGATELVELTAADSAALLAFCQREGLTPFPVLLTAFAVVLARLSRCDDIVIGAPMRDESAPGLSGCVGMLANTVALRTRLAGDPRVGDLLDHARRNVVAALEHQSYPWERLARTIAPHPDLSHNPVFQSMFVLNPAGRDIEMPGLTVKPATLPDAPARFDLTLALAQEGAQFRGQIDYATDLFGPATITRIAGYFARTVRAILGNPTTRVSELDILGPEERELLRTGGHAGSAVSEPSGSPWASGASSGTRLVPELIAARAASNPNAVAVIDGDRVLTYGELVARANGLAWRLRAHGIGPETLVAMAFPASLEAVVAIAGIQAAGGAYLPLDPRHPAERLAALLADARPAALVAGEPIGGIALVSPMVMPPTVMPPTVMPIVSLGDDRRDTAPPTELRPANLAYVIYTSGSTGAPKGVAVQHGTLANLARAFADQHPFGRDDRVLMIPPLTFDASAGDVFPALISGSALVLCPDPAELSGQDVLRMCAEHGITMVDTAAPLWQKWVDDLVTAGTAQSSQLQASQLQASQLQASQLPASPLRVMMVGGDVVTSSVARAWVDLTGAALVNHYGPTEATVCATTHTVPGHTVPGHATPGEERGQRLPIGAPLPHVRAYVLDDAMRAVPLGVPGELCLGGDTLARGYLGRGDLTAHRFVPDPFGAPGSRLYRTGDLARWRPDGMLEFLGRVDRQVKVRGHRIEPAEIEAACRRHPGVTDALVVARASGSGDKRLVGYVVPAAPGDLREFLRGSLPEYLVPAAFVGMAEFPLTPNGKLDHAALPAFDAFGSRERVEPAGETAKVLAAEWAALLAVDQVGADDNFFELGGHSLLAARLVTRLRVALGVEVALQAVFESPTLADLAAAIERRPAGPGVDLWAEAALPADAQPGAVSAQEIRQAIESAAAARSILLTGATGFLGSYLLADALEHTDARVFCLVRARSEADGLARIERTLRGHQRWRPEFADRIVALPGDLAAARLGLPESRFDALAGEIDMIQHCGGLVNFAQPYADLKPANVAGTVEVLRLACRHRLTPVQFVSTLGIYPLRLPGLVTEDVVPDRPQALDRGYEQTKWVADTLVRAARDAGLPVSIHRPARVTGDSVTGIGPADDLFARQLRAATLLGAWPAADSAEDTVEDMAPVDYVARSIGWLSRQPATYGRDFHFYNPHTIRSDEIASTLRDFGFAIRTLPYAQWYAQLSQAAAEDPAIAAIAAVAGPAPDRRARVFDCTATERLLAGAGLSWPATGSALLRRYVAHYVAAGQLPPPAPHGGL